MPPLWVVFLAAVPLAAEDFSLDLKKMSADAAKGAAIAAVPVGLPAALAIESDNPPAPEKKQIQHDREYPALRGEDEDAARMKNRAGLTEAHIKPEFEVSWSVGAGGKAWLERARIRFAVDQRMEISSSYPDEGLRKCPYEATQAHENGHWNDNRTFLSEELAGLKQDLIAIAIPTKDNPTTEDQTDAYAGKIVAAIKKHQKAFTTRAKEARAKRDDPEAYKKNDYSKCSPEDWRGREF